MTPVERPSKHGSVLDFKVTWVWDRPSFLHAVQFNVHDLLWEFRVNVDRVNVNVSDSTPGGPHILRENIPESYNDIPCLINIPLGNFRHALRILDDILGHDDFVSVRPNLDVAGHQVFELFVVYMIMIVIVVVIHDARHLFITD